MHDSARLETSIFEARNLRASHSNSILLNEEDGCLWPCPSGAQLENLHGVITLGKDWPFPASDALFKFPS